MRIKTYSIDESAARRAQEANSFRDYAEGSATTHYLYLVDTFNHGVEDLLKRNQKQSYPATAEQLELVEYYADKYSRKLAEATNRENSIRASCPSVMISGAGNFPVRKKQKQNAAQEKFWHECGELFDPLNNYYFAKIETLLTNKTIYSNDAFVLEKLQGKLKDLEEKHAERLKWNAYYRKNKTLKGFDGLTDEAAEKLDKEIENSFYKVPCPSYALSNDTAEIKRIKDRIAKIEKLKAEADNPAENKYPQVDGVEVVENAEAMRIQLKFNGKPDETTRNILKSNGFRWSPSFGAWQRQLTSNGIYATKKVLKQLQGRKE